MSSNTDTHLFVEFLHKMFCYSLPKKGLNKHLQFFIDSGSPHFCFHVLLSSGHTGESRWASGLAACALEKEVRLSLNF